MTTRRRQYPLPAQRGEGQGEGCLQPVEVAFGQCLQGLPSPHSFVAGRGRKHFAEVAVVILSFILRTAQYLYVNTIFCAGVERPYLKEAQEKMFYRRATAVPRALENRIRPCSLYDVEITSAAIWTQRFAKTMPLPHEQ